MIAALKAEGGYLCSTEEREILRRTMWPDGHTLNREVVAKSALFIADLAGLKVPRDTKILMVMGEKIGREDRFSGEKLSPVLTVWKWTDFDEMLDRMEKILKFSGEGSLGEHPDGTRRADPEAGDSRQREPDCLQHGAYRSEQRRMDELSWLYGHAGLRNLGGNISCENINWKQFLMYTRVAVPVPNYQPSDEELFGAYLKKYGRD